MQLGKEVYNFTTENFKKVTGLDMFNKLITNQKELENVILEVQKKVEGKP